MTHSFAERPTLHCPDCGSAFAPEVWHIIDAAERPDLLARVQDGSLHRVVCPNGHTSVVDVPLLIYQPGDPPRLFYSPPNRTKDEQNSKLGNELLTWLAWTMDAAWRDEWVDGLRIIPRPALPALLIDPGVALAPAKARQAAIPPGVAAVVAEIVATLAAEGVVVQTPESLELALAGHPALRDKLEAAAREAEVAAYEQEKLEMDLLFDDLQTFAQAETWFEAFISVRTHPNLLTDAADAELARTVALATADDDEQLAPYFAERLALLRRARAVGVAQAFAEKMNTTAEGLEAAAAIMDAAGTISVDAWQAIEEVATTLQAEGVTYNSPEEMLAVMTQRPELVAWLKTWLVAALAPAIDTVLGPASEDDLAVPPQYRADMDRANEAEARYFNTSDPAALDEAVAIWEVLLNNADFAIAPEEFQLATFDTASRIFLQRYQAQGRLPDLERAIMLLQASVERTPVDSPVLALRLSNLSFGLSARYERTSDPANLDATLAAWEDAVRRIPRNSPSRASVLTGLGNGLINLYERTGDPAHLDAAIVALEDADRRAPADSPDLADILITLGNGLRARYVRTGQAEDLDAAIVAYKDAVDSTPTDSPDWANRLNNLGVGLRDRYARTGDPADLDAAIVALEDTVRHTLHDSPNRARHLTNLGFALRDRYTRSGRAEDLNAAIASYEAAIATLDRALLDSPVAFVLGQQERWAGLYAQTVDALAAAGRAADALAAAEGSKSRLLAGLVGRGELPAPPQIPAALVERERALAGQLNALDTADLAGRRAGAAGDDGGQGQRAVARRAAVVAELRAAWDEMAAAGLAAEEYVAARRGDRLATDGLAALAGALGPGAALLSLFITTGGRTLLWLWPAGAGAPLLLETDLDPDALLYDYLTSYEDEVLNRATHRALGRPLTHRWRALGRVLLGPLRPHLAGIEHLVIAPQGFYHQLPLHSLWLSEAGDTLIDYCAVSYVPALSLLERLRRREQRPAAPGAVFGYTPAGTATARERREREVFLGEAEDVARLLGVAPQLDGDATGAALEAATTGPLRLLHLSCHGYFNPGDALESGVGLADGVYTARRFMARPLPVDLVTLSACETGISGSLGGDEMAGFSMALLSAGARSPLLGLWSVEARTTARLLVDFYGRLWPTAGRPAADGGKAQALRQTMLALRDGRLIPPQPGFDPSDPYYWAPFALIGDWR